VYCTYQAQGRAREILLDYLNPEQLETFRATEHFDIVKTGSRRSLGMFLLGYPGFRVYRLSHGRYPVTLFTSPSQVVRSVPRYGYCIHSHGGAPPDDELLSIKLLLEHDEARFVSIAFRVSWPEASARLLFPEQQEFGGVTARQAAALRDGIR
jgi:hypothetical protein